MVGNINHTYKYLFNTLVHGWRNRGGGGGDREGPSPPVPMNSISWVGPGGTKYITKMGPFYFSLTVIQQLQ